MENHPILNYTESLQSTTSFFDKYSRIAFPDDKDRKITKGEHRLSKRDCEVLIRWLGRDCGVLVSEGDVRVVKKTI
jgi:charged multivesicular body protein 7